MTATPGPTIPHPTWAETAIWWSVYPLGACGAPISAPDTSGPHHRLSRLEDWFDHLIGLGCNGLALGPVWASTTHGYDVVDHRAIDPRLGDLADFDHVVAAAKARGIRVLLDGVFNHVSNAHPRFRQALADGPQSAAAGLFRRDPAQPDGYSRFEGHVGLVELDHASPEARAYVVDIMAYWLARGIDGWRLDAAYRVPRPFWADVLREVHARYPEAITVAEILHGDHGQMADEAGFTSITQYEVWKAIWSSLHDRNPHELAWALARHDRLRGHELPWTFVGNHDVTRIASQVGAAAAAVALGLIMTLPGMSALYYGDEFGYTGIKEDRAGGDDAIRPELPGTPTPSTAEEAATYRMTQLAIRTRRARPWLATAALTVVRVERAQLTYRVEGAGQWLEVTLDTSATPPRLALRDAGGSVEVNG